MELELNLARKLAWSFHQSTGIEYEELLGEAIGHYIEAVHKYNPDLSTKTKLTTWATSVMRNRLIRISSKPASYGTQGLSEHEQELLEPKAQVGSPEYIFRAMEFKELLANLSKDAQDICLMIFGSPEEFLTYSSRKSRMSVKHKLQEMGKKWEFEIREPFAEIKEALKELDR